jgi:hypothetical protein
MSVPKVLTFKRHAAARSVDQQLVETSASAGKDARSGVASKTSRPATGFIRWLSWWVAVSKTTAWLNGSRCRAGHHTWLGCCAHADGLRCGEQTQSAMTRLKPAFALHRPPVQRTCLFSNIPYLAGTAFFTPRMPQIHRLLDRHCFQRLPCALFVLTAFSSATVVHKYERCGLSNPVKATLPPD